MNMDWTPAVVFKVKRLCSGTRMTEKAKTNLEKVNGERTYVHVPGMEVTQDRISWRENAGALCVPLSNEDGWSQMAFKKC